ncbi:Uncharacterised protein [Mycobacteroides abscessus]|nr:Uncharacterised protein [Mycobacteroides abscessus]
MGRVRSTRLFSFWSITSRTRGLMPQLVATRWRIWAAVSPFRAVYPEQIPGSAGHARVFSLKSLRQGRSPATQPAPFERRKASICATDIAPES